MGTAVQIQNIGEGCFPCPSSSDSMLTQVSRLRTSNRSERNWQWKARRSHL